MYLPHHAQTPQKHLSHFSPTFPIIAVPVMKEFFRLLKELVTTRALDQSLVQLLIRYLFLQAFVFPASTTSTSMKHFVFE